MFVQKFSTELCRRSNVDLRAKVSLLNRICPQNTHNFPLGLLTYNHFSIYHLFTKSTILSVLCNKAQNPC
jgi:hypothetical protein